MNPSAWLTVSAVVSAGLIILPIAWIWSARNRKPAPPPPWRQVYDIRGATSGSSAPDWGTITPTPLDNKIEWYQWHADGSTTGPHTEAEMNAILKKP